MGTRNLVRIFLTAALVYSCSAMADVNDTAAGRMLSIHGSDHAIVIPRDDWVLSKEQRRPGDTAVYYALASERQRLNFSVFIDKTSVCQSSSACLDESLKNPQYKDAKDLRKSTDRQFAVAQFFIDNPNGLQVMQANLIVAAYIGGQWFDIHISQVGKERPPISTLLELLTSISVR